MVFCVTPKVEIHTWRTTTNALEGVAASRNDILMLLDELGQADIDDLPKTIYDLSSGAGKERLDRNARLAHKRKWRVIFVSSGEISPQEAMETSRNQVKGGQLVRMIGIDIEDGIIVDSHGKSSVDFVDGLKTNCATHYGWAGPMFIEELIKTIDTHEGQKELEDDYHECIDLLSTPGLEAEQHRVVKRFALVLLAGIYAVKYGILPLEEDEIIAAVQTLCSRWLKSADHLSDSVRAIENIQDYLSLNGSRFEDLDSEDSVPHQSRLGWQKLINGTKHYLFPKDIFYKAIKGSSYKAVIKKLIELRLLHRNNGTKSPARFKVPGSAGSGENSKPPFYTISADILAYGQEAEEPRPMRRVLANKPLS